MDATVWTQGQAFQNVRLGTSIIGVDIYDFATLTLIIDMIGDEAL